ncbi:DUF21 domain-containing protein [bacterium]|nr:DUF21 domain-containing protein [bacterium]
MLLSVIIIVISLLGSAFFSGTETALISLFRKRNILKQLPAGVGNWLDNPEDILSVTLIGTNLCIVLASSVATNLFIKSFGDVGELYSLITISIVGLIFCEILPKSLGLMKPVSFSRKAILPLDIIAVILKPASSLTNALSRWIVAVFHKIVKPSKPADWNDFKLVSQQGTLDIGKSKEEIIHLLFEVSSLRAFDIMEPKTELLKIKLSELSNRCEDKGQSNYIAVEDEDGSIFGIFNRGSSANLKEDIEKEIMDTVFIPENTSVLHLFTTMFQSDIDSVLIVNEHSEVTGMVERRDILAFLCGIQDTPNRETTIEDGSFVFKGTTELTELEDLFNTDFPKGQYRTLGGFIEEYRHEIPRAGTVFKWGKYIVTIEESTVKKVEKVRIKPTMK